MGLKMWFCNFGNILGFGECQYNVMVLDSLILINGVFDCLCVYLGWMVYEIDCMFVVEDVVGDGQVMCDVLILVMEQVSEVICGGVGYFVLFDMVQDEVCLFLFMILVVGVVYVYLIKQGLCNVCLINVCIVECFDGYYVVVFIGFGVMMVNFYLVFNMVMVDCLVVGGDDWVCEWVWYFKDVLDGVLLKILFKMGILIIFFYCGGCNFEVLGFLCVLVEVYLFGVVSCILGIGLFGFEVIVVDLYICVW